MTVIRVHKTKDFTVMSNFHLSDRNLSWKAKGMLSVMLSLPENWDYSVLGLTSLSTDGKNSTANGLSELETNGYVKRTRAVDARGRFAGYDYDIYEIPQVINPLTENPNTENPNTDNPTTENPPQYNTNKSNTQKQNTDLIEKEERKSKAAANSFDLLIEDYLSTYIGGNTDEVRELLKEWLKVRKAKRAAMTDKAIELNLRKLNATASKSNMTVEEYLEAVIMRGWQAFYDINDYSQSSGRSDQSSGSNPFLDIAKEEGIF